MFSHPVTLKLVKKAGVLIATSGVNLFGCLSPTTMEHVDAQIEEIDLIIDEGKYPIGIESTVLDLTSYPDVLRPGGLPLEEIKRIIGKIEVLTLSRRPCSPGQLSHHCSPQTPIKIIRDKEFDVPESIKIGIILFNPPKSSKLLVEKIEVLYTGQVQKKDLAEQL